MEPSDDTIQIERTCGQCYHWRESRAQPDGKNGHDVDAPPMGLCFRDPPTAVLIQQVNPLTRQPQPGTMNIRPPLSANEPACGSWCPHDIDPFAGLEVPADDPV